MIDRYRQLVKRIKRRFFQFRKRKPDNLEGKVIRNKRNLMQFSRNGKIFNVKKDKTKIIYENYEDWKLIQSLKGRKGEFLNHWEKTKEKQIKNWDFLGVKENDKMLEVGFRDGYNLKYLFDKGVKIEGIEINSDAVDGAKNLGCLAFEEDIQKKTRYNDKTFDKISACDVLEHCFSAKNALKEMHRILKDDGRILIEIPFEKDFDRNVLHGHSYLFYNEEYFKKIINSLGFKIEKKNTSSLKRSVFILKKIVN